MDDKERMAEMEELLREAPMLGAVCIAQRDAWRARCAAILAPPSDPDAVAKEVHAIWGGASSSMEGWRAVVAWADKRVADARAKALKDAWDVCVGMGSRKEIADLMAKAGADDAA